MIVPGLHIAPAWFQPAGLRCLESVPQCAASWPHPLAPTNWRLQGPSVAFPRARWEW